MCACVLCVAGPLLNEGVDDLEWVGGEVEVVMQRDPPHLTLFSSRQQSLEVCPCMWVGV